MKNVAEVDARGLCLECGTCVGLCPHHNVRQDQDPSGRYRIRISDERRCYGCAGICLKVCPGHEVNVDALNRQVFGKLPANYWSGNYIDAYLGYATDPIVRGTASSGGIVSGLLIHAIETGQIAGAFLVRTIPGRPFSPSLELATTRAEVLAAAGSKYWPAPVGQRLGDILRGNGRFAFVGVPCEIQALRKAQGVFKPLRDKIAFCIGLCCGRRAIIAGQHVALRKLGIDPNEVSEMRYRQGEWPGHLVVWLRDGTRVDVPRAKQLPGFSGHLFPHRRCLLCHDSISELADISVGDAIRLEQERRENEMSLIVARTGQGAAALASACDAQALALRRIEIEAVVHAQKRPLVDKRRALWARLRLAALIPGLAAPTIRLTRPADVKPVPMDYYRGLSLLVVASLARSAAWLRLLRLLPLSWLQRYETFENLPSRR